jgi:O-antigen ligase
VGKAKISLHKSISLPALCFIATGLLSVFNAKDPILSAFELALIIELFLVFFYLANHLRNIDDFRFVIHVLLVGFLILALSVIAMYFFGSYSFMGLGSETLVTQGDNIVRSSGLIIHPNSAGAYLSFLSIIAFAILLMDKSAHLRKPLAFIALVLGLVALILTFSRSGWVSFAIAGLVFSLLALRRRWLKWEYVVLSIVILSLLLFLYREQILLRLFGDDGGAAAARMPLNLIALNMIKTHPWIGVGINNFVTVAPDYLTLETYKEWIGPAHNKYLLVWSETGTIGIISFMLFYLAITRENWNCYKSNTQMFSILGAAVLSGLCGFAVHMMASPFRSRSELLLLWIIAAISTSMSCLIKNSSQSQSTQKDPA